MKKSHLKLQVDSLLPAVPKLTKRGKSGTNSCSAGMFVPGQSTDTDTGGIKGDVSVLKLATHLLPIRSKSPESCAATKSLHFEPVVTVVLVQFL